MKALPIVFSLYMMSFFISIAAMEFLAWLLIIPTVVISIKKKQWLLPNKTILISLVGYATVSIISYFINGGLFEGISSYLSQIRWIALYLGLVQFFNLNYKSISFRNTFFVAQILLIITCVYALFQMVYGIDLYRGPVTFHRLFAGSQYFRPNGFFNLPTTFAYATTMFYCLILAHWLWPSHIANTKEKIVNCLYFTLQPMVILATFTRAAWICFLISTLTLIALTKKRLLAPVLTLLVVALLSLYVISPTFSKRVNSITDMTFEGNYHRIHLWNAYFHMFNDHPLFGTSINKNQAMIDDYLNKLNKQDVLRSHPHNMYINVLSGLGLFGLFFFMLFIVEHFHMTMKNCIHLKRQNPQVASLFLGALGLQITIIIGGLTECTFKDTELTHQYIAILALAKYLHLTFGQKSKS